MSRLGAAETRVLLTNEKGKDERRGAKPMAGKEIVRNDIKQKMKEGMKSIGPRSQLQQFCWYADLPKAKGKH